MPHFLAGVRWHRTWIYMYMWRLVPTAYCLVSAAKQNSIKLSYSNFLLPLQTINMIHCRLALDNFSAWWRRAFNWTVVSTKCSRSCWMREKNLPVIENLERSGFTEATWSVHGMGWNRLKYCTVDVRKFEHIVCRPSNSWTLELILNKCVPLLLLYSFR